MSASGARRAAARLPTAVALALLRIYQVAVSPILPAQCKYHPTCSQYAADAFRECGFFRGLVLAGWRLLRCNPWSHGGVDPVEQQRLFRPRAPSQP